MRRKRTVLVSTVLVLLATGVSAFLPGSCANKAEPLQTVRIGIGTTAITGLAYVAEEKGFLRSRGINASMEDFNIQYGCHGC